MSLLMSEYIPSVWMGLQTFIGLSSLEEPCPALQWLPVPVRAVGTASNLDHCLGTQRAPRLATLQQFHWLQKPSGFSITNQNLLDLRLHFQFCEPLKIHFSF